MIYWINYKGHKEIKESRNSKIDSNIYTFDIETTSYIILDGKQYETIKYLEFDKKTQEQCKFQGLMYIWQFGINDTIYYGRTFEELKIFLSRIEEWGTDLKKVVFVHNLAWEFQFLRNIFKFDEVYARKSHKVMKATLLDFNYEFRCTLFMTNAPLKKLPKIYNLDVEKLVGDLDYSKIRHSKTKLTKKELQYCENDCLVVYKYILREKEKYKKISKIPLTSTGHVRKELKNITYRDFIYKLKVQKSVNTDGHIYELMHQCFAGGYTHANYLYTDEIVKDVDSFDETSAYPYVMVTCKFPMTKFKKCNIRSYKQFLNDFAYIIKVRFKNIKAKYYNTFISQSKCVRINKAKLDNGRIIEAKELEIVITEVDFKLFLESYDFEYEILECYYARKGYLPKKFIEFILEKYIKKTEYKNVKDKELEYNLEKAMFNSLYGMTVTNNIRDKVEFDNETGWKEIPISNEEILEALKKEENKGFLSFSWGLYVTSYARYNLCSNIIKLDKYCIYGDTDSMKLKKGYDRSIIENYNKSVEAKIKKASNDLKIPIEKFAPKDIKGISHMLGLFTEETRLY